ncbi:MAG: hypothetical protein GX294_00580 [Candidatus Cloacimonetes bacterium]|nr:hypothetical protein [Candidatus Cloacimonadota bacterium]
MKKYLLISLLILQTALLMAVFDDYIPSARARGMGGAYTAVVDDAAAVFFNPAGLAQVDYAAQLGFSQLNGQSFADFRTAAAGVKLPAKLGTIGIGARIMGVSFEDLELMSEQAFTLAHGFVLQHDVHSTISVGYAANYYRLSFDDEDTDNAFGLDLGVSALLHGRTRLAFNISNLNQAKMGNENQSILPSKMALGISYQPYDKVITSIEVKKDFARETEFMGGVEAYVLEPLAIRFGVHQNPATWNAGVGLDVKNIKIDFSYSAHAVLPSTLYGNLGYEF